MEIIHLEIIKSYLTDEKDKGQGIGTIYPVLHSAEARARSSNSQSGVFFQFLILPRRFSLGVSWYMHVRCYFFPQPRQAGRRKRNRARNVFLAVKKTVMCDGWSLRPLPHP
jgi:hypothetical protein